MASTTYTVESAADAGKGHIIRMVAVADSAWGAVSIDDTQDLRVFADAPGLFRRTLRALLNKPSIALSVDLALDPTGKTAVVEFPLSGEPQSEDGGNPEFYDCYVGETVEIGSSGNAGIITDGVTNSIGVLSGTAITNSSTVTKPEPIGNWWNRPNELHTGDTATIRVFARGGHDVTGVDITITDSAAGTSTAAASIVLHQGLYGSAEAVWEATIGISGLADGVSFARFVATSVNGTTLDSNAASIPDLDLHIDRVSPETRYTADVDESFDMDITGTFSAVDGDILIGGTSGAEAKVCIDKTNTGAITLVRRVGSAFTSGETLTGFTSGTATVGDGVETSNASGSPALDDPANPYPDIGSAAHAIALQRSVDGNARDCSGCTIRVKSRYFTANGRTSLGFVAIIAPEAYTVITSVSGDMADCAMISGSGGGSLGNTKRTLWHVRFKNIEFHQHGTGSSNAIWGWSSNDEVETYFGGTKFIGRGQTVDYTKPFKNVKVCYTEDHWEDKARTKGIPTPVGGRFYVLIGFKVSEKEGDAVQVNNIDHILVHHELDDLLGDNATHQDTVQLIESCNNIVILGKGSNLKYQGFFTNNVGGLDLMDGIYCKMEIIQINDGDIGAGCWAMHQSVRNVVLELSTIMGPTATVGGEVGKETSVNFIHETGRSDSIWIRGVVALGFGGYDDADAPNFNVCYSNCHSILGDAVGIRGTNGGDIADLFVSPWTNGGEFPGNDDTDWSSKSGGVLDSRLESRDIIGTLYDGELGTLLSAGGGIGFSTQVGGAISTPFRRNMIGVGVSIGIS